jgi:hypothetical protein
MLTATTTAHDPRLDSRIRDAILDLVADGKSIPEATTTVALGVLEEVRQEGRMGAREEEFAVRHVGRLGADLMTRIRGLVAA